MDMRHRPESGRNEQPRGKPRGIKTKDTGKSARPKGRGIGPGEIQVSDAMLKQVHIHRIGGEA